MRPPITAHPDPSTLMGFAAGSLSEPLAAAIAAHVALCASCRGDMVGLDQLGAALLVAMPAPAGALAAPDPTARLRRSAPSPAGPAAVAAADGLPAPLAHGYGLTLASVPWRWLGLGVWHHRLALSPGVTGDLRLLKIAAGRKMPAHSHGGEELTLVLAGAYSDHLGVYRRGDLQEADGDIEHRPVADASKGCICLVASERPARFTGVVGRLLQPWTGL